MLAWRSGIRRCSTSPSARKRGHGYAAPRLGHVSTGAVYLVVGIVALSAAIDTQVRATGAQGALDRLLDRPLGVVAVIGIAVGLIADACWQMIRAALGMAVDV
jgi:hypothetical protein